MSDDKSQVEPQYEVQVVVFPSNDAGTQWLREWLGLMASEGWRVQSTTGTEVLADKWGEQMALIGPNGEPQSMKGYRRLPALALTLIRTTATKTNTTYQEKETPK